MTPQLAVGKVVKERLWFSLECVCVERLTIQIFREQSKSFSSKSSSSVLAMALRVTTPSAQEYL